MHERQGANNTEKNDDSRFAAERMRDMEISCLTGDKSEFLIQIFRGISRISEIQHVTPFQGLHMNLTYFEDKMKFMEREKLVLFFEKMMQKPVLYRNLSKPPFYIMLLSTDRRLSQTTINEFSVPVLGVYLLNYPVAIPTRHSEKQICMKYA